MGGVEGKVEGAEVDWVDGKAEGEEEGKAEGVEVGAEVIPVTQPE